MTMTTVDEILEMHARLASGEARRLREAAGLSMNAVARELEISPGTVLRWEQNVRLPRGANELRYARFLQRLATPVSVPVTTLGMSPDYANPEFLKYLQTVVQEAVLRYGKVA